MFCSRASVAQMVSTAVNMDTPAAAPPCPAKSPSHRRTVPKPLVTLSAGAFMTINMLSITLQSQQLKTALSLNSALNLR